jgi:endonuclease/exonuclease/phosphatase family metal-dependent hydrolase
MNKFVRAGLLGLLGLASLGALAVGALVLSEWAPPAFESYRVSGGAPGPLDSPVKILTWNVGYAAMDRETDFFMDGGKLSRGRSAEAVQKNLAAIQAVLTTRRPDVALLQEVDVAAPRSYGIDERAQLSSTLSGYASVFTQNYKVPFVPVPLSQPMGGVSSGLLSLLRTTPSEAHGLRLPGRQAFPNRLFNLKRTMTVSRLPVSGGKQLVVMNLHLTAFDSVGNMRQLESAFVRERILKEQQLGHYVIVGGDWNSALPGGGVTPACDPAQDDRSWLIDMPADFAPPGWTWAVGNQAKTVRTLGAPLNDKTTCYATIDGFLLSPGIELRRVETLDLHFEHSDHNPVELEVALR